MPLIDPQQAEREMPPASKPDGVPNAGDAQPARQGHRVVLGGPYPPGWNGFLKAEPLGAGRAVAFPIQPRVVGEDLDTGADDERHEEKVQEVLHPQPRRETGGDGPRGRRDAGIPHEEILYRRQLPQCLSYGHADDGKHKTESARPTARLSNAGQS